MARGPTWRGVGAGPPAPRVHDGVTFLSREGPWSHRGLLQAGHHLPGLRWSGAMNERGRPDWPPSRCRSCQRAWASCRTPGRGPHPSGCRSDSWSCRLAGRKPDPASKVAQPRALCKGSEPPFAHTRGRDAAKKIFSLAGSIPKAGPALADGLDRRYRRQPDDQSAPHRVQRFHARHRRVRAAARGGSADKLEPPDLLAGA